MFSNMLHGLKQALFTLKRVNKYEYFIHIKHNQWCYSETNKQTNVFIWLFKVTYTGVGEQSIL